jgi:cation transport regulator ChaB
MKKLSEENRDALIKALETYLDTRDKRYMFLKISFRDLVSRINLEGSAHEVAWNIYSEFEKQQMLGSLMAHMNNVFDIDLYLNH